MSDPHGGGSSPQPRQDGRPSGPSPSTAPRPASGGNRSRLPGRCGRGWPRKSAATGYRRSHLLQTPEDSCYAVGPDGHHLTIFRPKVDAGAVQIVREAPVTLALAVASPLMVLLYQFHPRGPRGHAPFAWHLWPSECRVLPESGRNAPPTLTIRLVDSDDLRTRAVRRIELAENLAGSLVDSIRTQAASEFDPIAYARAVAGVHLDKRTLWAQHERIVASMAALY